MKSLQMPCARLVRAILGASFLPLFLCHAHAEAPVSLTNWTPLPADWKGATIDVNKATLTSEKWSCLRAADEHANAELSATVTILKPANQFQFFGESWSAWPDSSFGDRGFEAALFLRATENSGYRIQLSHRSQAAALLKWPEGAASVSCRAR